VANVDNDPGRAVYTQLCNSRGGIEADVTIIRRSEDRFWLITGSALGVRDGGWLRSHAAEFDGVEIRDVTTSHGVINLAGPLARHVLAKATDADVSHESHPFMTAREINIGYAPALAFRVTYLGELGWELYIPIEYMQYAYEVLTDVGAEFDISDIGYRAIDSLRMEKRYLVWGADITPDNNPIEAGLGFVVDWEKGDFLGAEALALVKADGPARRLIYLGLDEPLPVFGNEAIFVDGEAVGQTTSGNFGYTIGQSLVLGYVPMEKATGGSFEIESFGRRTAAARIRRAAYDPDRTKILC
jgi:4-methylaminobutanoate oxidase (formaldehyde-forming)